MKWNKLVKVDRKGGGKTRIISIRTKLLEEAGVDPQAELQGGWEPVQGSKKTRPYSFSATS